MHNSKDYLKQVCEATKEGMIQDAETPKLNGHVVVLGIGDTAIDCAHSSFRLGADRVSVVFRRGMSDLRAGREMFYAAFEEKVDFIPFSLPTGFKASGNKVDSVSFAKHLPKEGG